MDDNNDDDHLEDLDCSESGLILMSQNDLAREHIPKLTQDENIKELIEKVRKVVIYFKRSPLKNETVLQKYVKIEHGKELSLLLDCKTRWNSLLTMLERFYLLKSCIQKALIDLNHPICLEDVEFELALLRKQIKSIVKRLNSRDDTEEEERSESLTDVELRPETSQPQLTLKEKLQLEIDKSMKPQILKYKYKMNRDDK
ncbi:hypothetical protein EVAR_16197_1 [Eumeta japonica]|uniref:Zinc finger BED domain-containing protein 4 n=1 Tax=Eumeta variegata TaxID=151549 RepID=A0A4C1U5Q1_EUMVA|nr:hypothetical protein EVAR_16197_1 [Eumeta japonica]